MAPVLRRQLRRRLRVIGTSRGRCRPSVDDTQVGLLAKGDQAQITDRQRTGTIFGTIVLGVGARLQLVGLGDLPGRRHRHRVSPTGLHAGATATVSMIYKQLDNVLDVPTLAVHTRRQSVATSTVDRDGKQVKPRPSRPGCRRAARRRSPPA